MFFDYIYIEDILLFLFYVPDAQVGVKDSCGCWKFNPCYLVGQQVLLAAKPFLYLTS